MNRRPFFIAALVLLVIALAGAIYVARRSHPVRPRSVMLQPWSVSTRAAGVPWPQWIETPAARRVDRRVKAELARAITAWTARGVPPGAFRVRRSSGQSHSRRSCYPFDRQHRHGRAADIWVGDLNRDGSADLVDFCLFASTLDQVRGGCGIFGWQLDKDKSEVWLHVDTSGRTDRWGAWHPKHGTVQPIIWSRRQRSVQDRCRAWGLSSNRKTMKLVIDKQPSALVFQPRQQVFSIHPTLRVYMGGRLVKAYAAALGLDPVGDKEKRDDYRTPEGDFYICGKNPRSRFHKSLRLSYPNAEDATRGLRDGLINTATYRAIIRAIRERRTPPQDTPLGGDIMLHGGGGKGRNWTWGCTAIDNREVDELFDFVPVGTTVKVLPVVNPVSTAGEVPSRPA
ncbi:MAG: L,D-transpeptidase [Armatimonadota bacterium]|nr:L,D-transpeptidase [Armatimonadota bacterium]